MEVTLVNTERRAAVRRFVQFPFDLYRASKLWVPPFVNEAYELLNRKKFPYYQHSEADFFLVQEGARTLGRIALMKNNRYMAQHGQQVAFFSLFDVEENSKAARMLFDTAFAWARKQGLTRIAGPRPFAPSDGVGVLIKGFEHRPAMGIPYNYPYYQRFVEEAGFTKLSDSLSGYFDATHPLPERVLRVAQLAQERRGFRFLTPQSKQELRTLAPKLKEIYNTTLGQMEGGVPITDAELDSVTERLLAVADPKLIKLITRYGEIVGFVFGFPDLSAAIQRCRGHLYPLGWIGLLREFKRTRWIDINGMGILEQHQGLGGHPMLMAGLYESMKAGNFLHCDLVQMGDTNFRMMGSLAELGVDFYKVHRVYMREVPDV